MGVVDEVVAVGANQREVGDVAVAFQRSVPREQVVGLAFAGRGAASDASAVSGDEPAYLDGCCVAFGSSLVEEFALSVEERADEFC